MDLEAVRGKVDQLHRALSELRPARRREQLLSSMVVTDRIDRCGIYLHIDPRAEDILGFPASYYYENEVDWLQTNHPLDFKRISRLWYRSLSGDPCRSVEYRTDNHDGQWVWLEDSFHPLLLDARGRALVIEGRWRDITPRKRREVEFLITSLESLIRRERPAPLPGQGLVVRFPHPVLAGEGPSEPANSRKGIKRGRGRRK